MSNMQQRILTGAAGIVLVVGLLYASQWGYFLLFGALMVLCQWEFYQLLFKDGNAPLKVYGTICGATLFLLSFFIEQGALHSKFYVLLFPVMAIVYFIKLYKRNEVKPFTNIGLTYLGIIYTALPFALLNLAVFSSGVYRFQLVMGMLLLLWASDTGAYFAGVRYGRTKLFERVSPKKSWEGSIGGAIASGTTAAILSFFFTAVNPIHWVLLAIIMVVAGTYGDLVESLFKRSIAIKDSGSAIPGHGGFLDRFDGLLISAPFVAALFKLWP